MTLDARQLEAFGVTARRFAQREVAPIFEGSDGRDGDLTRLVALLEVAEEAGLMASPEPESAGREYGVWGEASLGEDGALSSLRLLEEVSLACAGVASCLHVAGLATAELLDAQVSIDELEDQPRRAAVAFFDSAWRPSWQSLREPPPSALSLQTREGLRLEGELSGVAAPPESDAFIVYAAGVTGWERVLVPASAPGLEVRSVGQRLGLSALDVVDLRFSGTEVLVRLGPAAPLGFLRRHMLGLAAIAIGNATGALRASRQYAAERYQGGQLIDGHRAVQLLLGESGARIANAAAALTEVARRDSDSSDAAWRSLATKLRVTAECEQATSDCLQILGGYGYMEDYGLEKRLRDAVALKVMGIEPNTLKILCADTPLEVGGHHE